VNYSNKQTSNPIAFGLALMAGIGLVLMILAGGIGVTQSSDADPTLVSILFAAGLLVFASGVIAWLAVVQPYRHFDDIDVPMDEHGHGHDDHAPADETTVVPAHPIRATPKTVIEHDEQGHPISIAQH